MSGRDGMDLSDRVIVEVERAMPKDKSEERKEAAKAQSAGIAAGLAGQLIGRRITNIQYWGASDKIHYLVLEDGAKVFVENVRVEVIG